MSRWTIKDSPVHAKALLLGAQSLVEYEHIPKVKGKFVFVMADESPCQATARAADSEEEALQKLIEYLRR